MEVDLQSLLFGLYVTWCAQLYSLAETPQLPPPSPHLDSYYEALLVSKDRRHLFVTPWYESRKTRVENGESKKNRWKENERNLWGTVEGKIRENKKEKKYEEHLG